MIPTGQEQRRCPCGRPAVTISWLGKVLDKDNRWFCTACYQKEIELMVDLGTRLMEMERDSAKLAC